MKVIPDTSRALLILSVTWWRLFQTRVVLSWFWASLDEGYSRHESCSLDFERHLMKVIPDTSRSLLIFSVTWWRSFQTRVVLSWFWASLDEGYSRHESCSLDFERHLMKVIPDTSRALPSSSDAQNPESTSRVWNNLHQVTLKFKRARLVSGITFIKWRSKSREHDSCLE